MTQAPVAGQRVPQAEIREGLERLLARDHPESFGCLLYPNELGPLVALVRPGAVEQVEDLVSQEGYSSLVEVEAKPRIALWRDRAELVTRLRGSQPEDDFVSIKMGSIVASKCPRVEIAVDYQNASEASIRWARKQEAANRQDVFLVDGGVVDLDG